MKKRINEKELRGAFERAYGASQVAVARDPKAPKILVVEARFRDGQTMTLRGRSLLQAALNNPRLLKEFA